MRHAEEPMPKKQFITVEEVAATIEFLASHAARNITSVCPFKGLPSGRGQRGSALLRAGECTKHRLEAYVRP
jgi:hypothetical protein